VPDSSTVVAVVVVLTSLSGVACLLMIIYLFKIRASSKHRLFWCQLMALMVSDVVWAIIGIPPYFSWFAPSDFRCKAFLYAHQSLEFNACIIEVMIASGFAAACFRSTRVARVLRLTLFFTFPFAVLLLFVIIKIKPLAPDIVVREKTGECHIVRNLGWDVTVISICVATLAIYLSAVARTRISGTPGVVHDRELRRASCYAASFFLSFGLKAVQDLAADEGNGYNWFSIIAWCLLCMNGAMNALTYYHQTRSRVQTRTSPLVLSFHVSFSPNAVAEDINYFDIHSFEDAPLILPEPAVQSLQTVPNHPGVGVNAGSLGSSSGVLSSGSSSSLPGVGRRPPEGSSTASLPTVGGRPSQGSSTVLSALDDWDGDDEFRLPRA